VHKHRYTATEKLHRGYRCQRWRKAVLKKDNHTCVECGSKDKLTVDHIKPVVAYPHLAFDIRNGRTLCDSCRVKGMLKQWQNWELKPRRSGTTK